MRLGSRFSRLVFPLALVLGGCGGRVERDIDKGNPAGLSQELASPEGQEKLVTQGDRWLLRAVQAGQAESVAVLLRAGALRGTDTAEGRALLSHALALEDPHAGVAVLRVLVRHGVRPTRRDAQGRTALQEALERHQPRAVSELLALSPDLEAFDAQPSRLLVEAARLGDAESARGLVRAGALLEDPSLLSEPLSQEILRPLRESHLFFLLGRAAASEDHAALRALAAGTLPEVWDAMLVSPAHLAILADDPARLALALQEDPRRRGAVDERGLGLMHYAALSAEPPMATALARAEVDLEARTPAGRTPLLLAAHAGRGDMVRELLALGAEVNAEDAVGQCALLLAARGGHDSLVDALASAGALLVRDPALASAARPPSDFGKRALEASHARFRLRWALETGQRAEEVRLRREGVSFPPAQGELEEEPAVRAVLTEDLSQLEALAKKAPADFARALRPRSGLSFLHWAALGGAEKSAAWLLDQGAPLEAREPGRGASPGKTPLEMAFEEGQLGVATLLVERGAVWEGGTPAGGRASPEQEGLLGRARSNGELRDALRDGRLEALAGLLQAGAAVGAAEGLAPTDLAWRVLRGDPLRGLTRGEQEAWARESRGRSLLHYAAAAGNLAAVETVLGLGGPVSPRDPLGVTPLGYAARRGDVPTLRRLLEAHASALEPARPGVSALDAALCAPHAEAARLLLGSGGTPSGEPECWSRAVLQALEGGGEEDALVLLDRWRPAEKDFPPELALAAAEHGRARVVRWVLDHHAVLGRTRHGVMLERAVEAGAVDTVALLLERSPATDVKWELQETARRALLAGRPEVASLALDRGADPLGRSKETTAERLVGTTVAHPGQVSLVGLALALGARPFLEHLRQRWPEVWAALQKDPDYFPLAVRGGQLELVRRYVETGANLLGEDVTGAALLGTAGSVEVAAYLFEQGAILEPPPLQEEGLEPSVAPPPPFTVALARGHWDVARFFLSRGATARVAPVLAFLDARPGGDPLESLGEEGREALARLLQERAWTREQRGELARGIAQRSCVEGGVLDAALSGLSVQEVAERTGPALVKLTRCEDPRALEVLVRRGADPRAVDGSGRDVLAWALRARNAAAARALLGLGVAPLARVGGPFVQVRLAREMGLGELAREMLEAGLKDRELEGAERDSALVLAMRTHAWTLAARLLSQGASVREASGEESTALSLALSDGSPWMVELFLAMGATDSSGAALGTFLKQGERARARRLLFEGRVPPDVAFERLRTAGDWPLLRDWGRHAWDTLSAGNLGEFLRLAASRDDAELVAFVLERARLGGGLDVGGGTTLLHVAAEHGGARLVELLVERGADVNASGPRCTRPLDLARGREDGEGHKVAKWLQAHGARSGGCRTE